MIRAVFVLYLLVDVSMLFIGLGVVGIVGREAFHAFGDLCVVIV